MINQHWARHKDGESKFTCGTKLQGSSITGLSSAGGGTTNIRRAPSMSGVRSATRVASGEVVGRGTLSNARSVSTKSKNRAPSGGRHPLLVEDREGMAVGAALGLVVAAPTPGVPPTTTLLP
jgi:hypothetical protein